MRFCIVTLPWTSLLIFKSGNEHDLEHYRGITVSTILSNLYATGLERRISSWVEEHGLQAAGQAGSRRDHHTTVVTDNIFIMRTLLESCKPMKTSRQHGDCMLALSTFAKPLTPFHPTSFESIIPALEYRERCLMLSKGIMRTYKSVRTFQGWALPLPSVPIDSTMRVKQGCLCHLHCLVCILVSWSIVCGRMTKRICHFLWPSCKSPGCRPTVLYSVRQAFWL